MTIALQKYIHERYIDANERNMNALFYTDFDDVHVSFWKNTQNMECVWTYEPDRNIAYYGGLKYCMNPVVMRLHQDFRLTTVGANTVNGIYTIDLSNPVIQNQTDNGDLVFSVTITVTAQENLLCPHVDDMIIKVRPGGSHTEEVHMRFHTFPSKVAHRFVDQLPDKDKKECQLQLLNGTFNPWVVANSMIKSKTTPGIDYGPMAMRSAVDAARYASEAKESMNSATKDAASSHESATTAESEMKRAKASADETTKAAILASVNAGTIATQMNSATESAKQAKDDAASAAGSAETASHNSSQTTNYLATTEKNTRKTEKSKVSAEKYASDAKTLLESTDKSASTVSSKLMEVIGYAESSKAFAASATISEKQATASAELSNTAALLSTANLKSAIDSSSRAATYAESALNALTAAAAAAGRSAVSARDAASSAAQLTWTVSTGMLVLLLVVIILLYMRTRRS